MIDPRNIPHAEPSHRGQSYTPKRLHHGQRTRVLGFIWVLELGFDATEPEQARQ
jgi:hypothetical protein